MLALQSSQIYYQHSSIYRNRASRFYFVTTEGYLPILKTYHHTVTKQEILFHDGNNTQASVGYVKHGTFPQDELSSNIGEVNKLVRTPRGVLVDRLGSYLMMARSSLRYSPEDVSSLTASASDFLYILQYASLMSCRSICRRISARSLTFTFHWHARLISDERRRKC